MQPRPFASVIFILLVAEVIIAGFLALRFSVGAADRIRRHVAAIIGGISAQAACLIWSINYRSSYSQNTLDVVIGAGMTVAVVTLAAMLLEVLNVLPWKWWPRRRQ